MQSRDPAIRLAGLQDQIAAALAEDDSAAAVQLLRAAEGDCDPSWLEARVRNLQLQQSALRRTLAAYVAEGEALAEEYRQLHGEDRTIAIQEQVILEPARAKIQELDGILARLKLLWQQVRTAKRTENETQRIQALRWIGEETK